VAVGDRCLIVAGDLASEIHIRRDEILCLSPDTTSIWILARTLAVLKLVILSTEVARGLLWHSFKVLITAF
jgi:hypothetical protein